MKAAKVLTFDHIIPSFRGGKTTWEIVVAACSPIASLQSHLREVFTRYILG
jgi:5-methylcytosine-specific restriction endonuclease McrA